MKRLSNELNTEQLMMLQMEMSKRGKSKAVLWLLWLFLGGIGGHRYYLGKIGTGILYTCTLGIFGIGALVDIFFNNKMYRDHMDALEDQIADELLAQEMRQAMRAQRPEPVQVEQTQ